MPKVVNFSPLPTSAIEAQISEILEAEVVSIRDVEDEVEACRGAVVAIADFSGDRLITVGHAAALAKTCKAVVVPSTGVDSIDVQALRDVDVPIATAGGLNAITVAEWAVWATIGGLRQLAERDLGIREGRWEQFGSRYELAGKNVLLVGMGEIGQEVAARLRGFGVDLRYFTRTRREPDEETERGITWTGLDDGLAAADVVILAIALSDRTRRMIGPRRLRSMKASAVIVNAGRAELVEQDAVLAALGEKRLHAYVTDVFEVEPPPADDPMLDAATIVTPHVAGVSVESVGRILGRTIENVNRVLDGEEPIGLI